MDDEHAQKGLQFDSAAARYDEFRPGYPDALFDDLGPLACLTGTSQVLEVGCGTGQATRGLLDRGWGVLAVEPGQTMAELARQRFSTERFAVEMVRFEDWEPRARVDLVFSATAYHWVDPNIRWSKAASVLRPGGHLALATNRTVAGGTFHELYEAAGDLHATYAPGMDKGPSPSEGSLIDAVCAALPDIGRLWAWSIPQETAPSPGSSSSRRRCAGTAGSTPTGPPTRWGCSRRTRRTWRSHPTHARRFWRELRR